MSIERRSRKKRIKNKIVNERRNIGVKKDHHIVEREN